MGLVHFITENFMVILVMQKSAFSLTLTGFAAEILMRDVHV